MPQERLPFANMQASGLDPLGGASPVAMNVIVDPLGTITRRPGITEWCPDTVDADGITGLYEVVDGRVFAIGGLPQPRNIYLVSETGALNLSDVPEGNLAGDLRPIFAETEEFLVIAGGQEIQKVVLATNTSARLGGTPPLASHVIAINRRLLANSLYTQTGFIFYSATTADPDGNEDWSTAISTGSFSAEARPDPVAALWENSNEVCAFGLTSYQSFSNNQSATEPFATVTTKEIGCVAPYSVVKIDEQFGWLDHLRRFVISDGRSVTVISDPIQRTLHDMEYVGDCFGYRVTMGYLDTFVWTFPSDGRTFAYQKGAGWSQWSSYTGTSWGAFGGTSAVKLKANDTQLIGLSDGRIGQMDLSASSDLGEPINAYVMTGFIDHGTDNRKTVKKLRIALRRGTAIDSTGQSFLLSWRDSLGQWEPPIPISLGATGDTNPVVELYSLGVYRRRQWRIEFSGTEAFTLIAATEDFTVESN